jgi:hypothetical protein
MTQADPSLLLHMAELQTTQKQFDRARQLVRVLHGKVEQLKPADQEKLQVLTRMCDEAATDAKRK